MILKLKRTPGIYLVGFMGSGKSTIGRALADELGWKFFDLDDQIERREGVTIAEIFETRGEAAFRQTETTVLREHVRSVERGQPQVISLGGGAFLAQENADLVLNHGVAIWLDCPFSMIERRIANQTHRPLARDPDKLRCLFDSRQPAYARAHYRIEICDDDAQAAVRQILALQLF